MDACIVYSTVGHASRKQRVLTCVTEQIKKTFDDGDGDGAAGVMVCTSGGVRMRALHLDCGIVHVHMHCSGRSCALGLCARLDEQGTAGQGRNATPPGVLCLPMLYIRVTRQIAAALDLRADVAGPDGRRRCGLAEQALAVAVWPTAAFVLVLARHETSI